MVGLGWSCCGPHPQSPLSSSCPWKLPQPCGGQRGPTCWGLRSAKPAASDGRWRNTWVMEHPSAWAGEPPAKGAGEGGWGGDSGDLGLERGNQLCCRWGAGPRWSPLPSRCREPLPKLPPHLRDVGSHQATPAPPVREAGNPCTELLPLGGFIIVIPFYFGLGRQFITLRQHRLAPTKAAALRLCHPLQSTRASFEPLLS